MNELINYMILGFVQGVTEFFPISSSGHLVLFEDFFCLLYTSPSPRDATLSRMPSSA